MQVDIEKLVIFAFFLIFKVENNRKYTSDTYKGIVFQVPLTGLFPLIPNSFRLKWPNTQHSGHKGQTFSNWINGWNMFRESS